MRKKDDKVGNKVAYKKKRKGGGGGGGGGGGFSRKMGGRRVGEESGFFPKNWQLTVFLGVLFSAFE